MLLAQIPLLLVATNSAETLTTPVVASDACIPHVLAKAVLAVIDMPFDPSTFVLVILVARIPMPAEARTTPVVLISSVPLTCDGSRFSETSMPCMPPTTSNALTAISLLLKTSMLIPVCDPITVPDVSIFETLFLARLVFCTRMPWLPVPEPTTFPVADMTTFPIPLAMLAYIPCPSRAVTDPALM